MAIHELGHSVVGDTRELWREIRAGECFNRRRAERNHLPVVAELVHQTEARVEIAERLHLHRAAEHPLVRRVLLKLLQESRRHEMRKDVELAIARDPTAR